MEKNISKILITAANKELLTQLLKEHDIDIACTGGIRPQPDGSINVEAFMDSSYAYDRLVLPGVQIKFLGNADTRGLERRKDVNRGNKDMIAGLTLPIHGTGIKE
jgi:hypothetical protein